MVDSNEEDDDEVFTALQTIAKKPFIKVDRSILKRKSPDADNGGTPRRTRLVSYLFYQVNYLNGRQVSIILDGAFPWAHRQNPACWWSVIVINYYCVNDQNP